MSGDALLDETENCLVHAENRLVVCAGVRDLAVIETEDAVLVSDRRETDAGKRLVALLQKAGRAEATTYADAKRPWDGCRVLQHGPGFEVRELTLAPGACVTLQSHEQRPEHWVVVAGAAKVTVRGNARSLEPSQAMHVPSGARSRIENPGRVPARIIQVQCAVHASEDGITLDDEGHPRR